MEYQRRIDPDENERRLKGCGESFVIFAPIMTQKRGLGEAENLASKLHVCFPAAVAVFQAPFQIDDLFNLTLMRTEAGRKFGNKKNR